MSKTGPADAALPGASPAERTVSSAPALRNWRLARRLVILVAIPTVLGLTLAGVRVADSMHSAEAGGKIHRLAELSEQVTGLAQAIEDERADTAAFIVRGRPAAGVAALHRQYVITDAWAVRVRRMVPQLERGYPVQARVSAATVLASIAELPGLRNDATRGRAPVLNEVGAYSAAINGLFPVDNGIADLTGNSALITTVRTLGSLSRIKDQASLQQTILGTAITAGHFGRGALAALTTAETRQASDLVSFRASATREQNWALTRTLAGPLSAQARSVEQHATAAGVGTLALGGQASRQWQAGMSYMVGWMRNAERQLAGWTTAYALVQQRSATQSMMITGGAALAALLLVVLATVILARSLARPMRRLEVEALEAARVAGEEAPLTGSVSAISVSFLRRSSSLLEPLLRLIDRVELDEDDPERLAALFQIDHLATRMRRNSDSALVLAGHETPPRWTDPVTLVDVLRAAVSEIEQYDRVALDVQPAVCVSASAAVDVVHLLAELLENATTFSPTATQVIVSGRTAPDDGWVIIVTDRGIGIREDQRTQLNWLLSNPPLADAAAGRPIGLFAVAHLATRHGIKVTLGPSAAGGSAAEVHVPAALLSRAPLVSYGARPGGPRRQAGEVRQAGGSRRGDAVPQLLGAPLSPQPPAVTAPERAGAGPGRLPIFESVESEYFRARGGPQQPAGLPRRTRRPRLNAHNVIERETPQPTAAQSAQAAQIAQSRLASFQQGSRRARMDRNKKSAQDG